MLVLRAKKLCLIKVNCRTMSDEDDYCTILGCGELSLYCNNDINNPATMQYINNYGPCHLSTPYKSGQTKHQPTFIDWMMIGERDCFMLSLLDSSKQQICVMGGSKKNVCPATRTKNGEQVPLSHCLYRYVCIYWQGYTRQPSSHVMSLRAAAIWLVE